MIKTWFITGTSTGFGRLLTEMLLARGDRVMATLRTPGPLDDLRARYPDALSVATLDITDTAAVREVIDSAFRGLGRIDVIVSNAGYGLLGAAEEVSDEQIRRQLDTNVVGSIQVVRAALPHLRAQNGGRILQVSSEGGQMAYPGISLYHASKWAIEGFIESVAQEVAPFGIEITLVEPGPARTSFGAGLARAPAMAAYDKTPAGAVRRAFADGTFKVTGDPARMVQAMIDSADQSPAPRRLTLGSTAYDSIHAALSRRLAELEAQRDVALAADLH